MLLTKRVNSSKLQMILKVKIVVSEAYKWCIKDWKEKGLILNN